MLTHKCPQLKESRKQANSFGKVFFYDTTMELKKKTNFANDIKFQTELYEIQQRHQLLRTVLICLVILVHIVNFGDTYPNAKIAISAFIMPSFLIITGYLVNINKSIRDFALYILRIWLPYMILVIGYAALSLFLPVRDGIKTFDIPAILNILFIKSIGPYWFLHVMIVCGIVYYFTFHIFNKLNITAKYSIFATVLIAVTLLTPLSWVLKMPFIISLESG